MKRVRRTHKTYTRPSRSRRVSGSAWLFLATVSSAAVMIVAIVGCQTAPGKPNDPKWLNVTSVRRKIEVDIRAREQKQESKVGAGKTTSIEHVYEESVRIEADGSVYHPNLLEFTLGGLFGLVQQDFSRSFDGRDRHFSEDGDVLEFDFEGQFFKKKPFPGSAFARRSRRLQPRPFLSSLDETTTSYGLTWQYVSARTPTNLQFSHTEVVLDPLDPREATGEQENTSFRFNTEYRFSDENVLSFTYDHQAVSERPFELDYTSDEWTLDHRLDFGPASQHRLESELQYFDQSGTFNVRRFRWRETLRLQHTENLRSWYRWELLDRKQGTLSGVNPIGETSYYLSGTVEHKLYESLTSELFGFGQYQDFDSGLRINRLGIQPSFDYRKKNRWGLLLAGYAYRLQQEERNGAGRAVAVVDERGTFNDPDRVVLNNTNVRLESIFVTSADRLTLYRPGDDYRVEVFGDMVELERVPTGRIPDGGDVLIDYTYDIGGDFRLDTVNHSFFLQQNFSFGLSPYYRFRKQNQDITPRGATGAIAEDITANTFGTIYQNKGVRLQAEYEDHVSNINPFRALRLNTDLSRKIVEDGTARLRVRWTDVDRSGRSPRSTELFTIEGRYRQRIGGTLTFEGALLYRVEHDSLSGVDRGVDGDLAIEFASRQTEARLVYEYGRFDDDFARNRNQSLLFQFRRRF